MRLFRALPNDALYDQLVLLSSCSTVLWALVGLDWTFGACFHHSLKSKVHVSLLAANCFLTSLLKFTFITYRAVLNLFTKNMTMAVENFKVCCLVLSVFLFNQELCGIDFKSRHVG